MSMQIPGLGESFDFKSRLVPDRNIDRPCSLVVEPSMWQSRFGAAAGARFDVFDGDVRRLSGGGIEQVVGVLNEWHMANKPREPEVPKVKAVPRVVTAFGGKKVLMLALVEDEGEQKACVVTEFGVVHWPLVADEWRETE